MDNIIEDKSEGQGTAGSPKKPSMGNLEDQVEGDYKFNLGLYRLDSLNKLLNLASQRYHKAFLKTEPKYVEKYQAIVNTLFVETYIYMKDETDIEDLGVQMDKEDVLKQKLDEKPTTKSGEELEEHLQELRAIYIAVRELLKQVGLDIPREEVIGDTDIFRK